MKHRLIEDKLIGYWREIRGIHPIPLRTDIDFSILSEICDYHFIIRRKADDDVRISTTGPALNEYMRMDVRRMQLVSFFHHSERVRTKQSIENVFTLSAHVRLDIANQAGDPETVEPSGSVLFLPLFGEIDTVDYALGSFFIDKTTPPPPFYVLSETIHITRNRVFLSTETGHLAEAAESPASFEGGSPSQGSKHLRLVRSSKDKLHHKD